MRGCKCFEITEVVPLAPHLGRVVTLPCYASCGLPGDRNFFASCGPPSGVFLAQSFGEIPRCLKRLRVSNLSLQVKPPAMKVIIWRHRLGRRQVAEQL
jgi:hypothetical protein